MSATIDAFLGQILQSVSQRDGQRLTSCIVLDFDSLPEDRRRPYGDLHNELNQLYPSAKDSALSNKVKQALPANQLMSCHAAFTESITQYFRYVRDYVNDSALLKARKIEKLTRQCIITLRDDQPGPIMIPLVLHLTSILRQVAINLDRDPTLTAQSASTATEDEGNVSFVENTGNVLREAFNKCIQRSRPTQPPTPNSLSSGLYLILNSCMSLYNRAGKLRNAEFLLGTLDKTSPPLNYYPASQRVTYLYFLGKFHFASNHFYRAVTTLQTAYDQCAKNTECINQRRLILIHLIAAGLCIGRLPSRILIIDQAAHNISKPFLELSRIIKSGDIGRFHTYLDYTLPSNTSAQWFLRNNVLLQLSNRCEVLCWRSLVLKAMKHAGFLGGGERPSSMPFLRFTAISEAAHFSYARAREQVARQSHGTVHLDEQDNDYVDPDFVDVNHDDDYDHDDHETASTPGFGQSPAYTPSSAGVDKDHVDHLPLLDPTPEEINAIVLSLISQGFLKGFVSHTHPDLLQSRFAIPGIRARTSESSENAWKAVGFPAIFEVVKEKELAADEGDVPGWVTEEKVQKREEEKARGGGGRVIRITGAKPAGMA